MGEITQEVNVDLVEKLPDGNLKRKYPKTTVGQVVGLDIATQAEAQAGTSDVKYMTPLRTKEAIDARKKTLNRTVLGSTVAAGSSRIVNIPIGEGKVGGVFIVASKDANRCWKQVYFTDKLIDIMYFDSNSSSSSPKFAFSSSSTEVTIVISDSKSTGYTYTYENSTVGYVISGSNLLSLGLKNPKIVGSNLTFEIFNSRSLPITENCELIWEVW